MFSLKILSKYLFKLYCSYFFAILLLISGILILSNCFDVLQKFKNTPLSFPIFWKLVFYKIPYLLNEIISLISFIAMLFFLKKLTQHNEFIALLSSGVNAWKIFTVPIFSSFLLGICFVTMINPIGALGLKKYEVLEAALERKKIQEIIFSDAGMLFFESYNNTNRVIQIQSIDVTEKKLTNLIILFVDDANNLIQRIDAKSAFLNNNQLKLSNARVYSNDNIDLNKEFVIPTNLSVENLTKRFQSPEIISIWQLPLVIKQLKKSGFPVLNYQLYYYKQLFKPIIMMTTVILASRFISLNRRNNSQEKILGTGLFLGFSLYLLLEVLLKMLAYNSISPILSALIPTMLLLFISIFSMLHFQKT